MTKSLQEIQNENRKFILRATGEYKDELELLKQIYNNNLNEIVSRSFFSKPLTLSRVLLAICEYSYHDDIWLNANKMLEFDLKGVSFDLTKETLEEQSEETQRGINKLFNY